MVPYDTNLASAGVLAAELLVGACGTGDDLHAGTVRGLAEDLGRGLAALPKAGTSNTLTEAALACADLSTLAACNVSALPEEGRPAAVAAAHLAAGTTRALVALAEAGLDGSDDGSDDAPAEYAAEDVRSAGWKADLAVRQLGGAG